MEAATGVHLVPHGSALMLPSESISTKSTSSYRQLRLEVHGPEHSVGALRESPHHSNPQSKSRGPNRISLVVRPLLVRPDPDIDVRKIPDAEPLHLEENRFTKNIFIRNRHVEPRLLVRPNPSSESSNSTIMNDTR